MKSPMGGSSSSGMSMKTKSTPRPHGGLRLPLVWKLYRDQSGQIKFRKVVKKEKSLPSGLVSVTVTVPRKVLEDEERMGELVSTIRNEGGEMTSAGGRIVSVTVDSESLDEIGDILDSFGCQWDA